MKINVRAGMFETNSSSAHSLLIMKKRQTMTQQEIRDEYLMFLHLLEINYPML